MLFDYDSVNLGGWWALPKDSHKSIERRFISFGDNLNSAIGEVLHIALDTKPLCVLLSKITEVNPLDSAVYKNVALHFLVDLNRESSSG